MALALFFQICLLTKNVSSRFQYEQLNGGSEEKHRALRDIKETVLHRKHLDSSIDFIGKLVFGFDKGPSMLQAARGSGQPLVDDWDCLKRMVRVTVSYSNPINMQHPVLFLFPVELTLLNLMPTSGSSVRVPVRITHSVRHETYEGVRKHLQQWSLRGRDEGGKHQRL